MKHEATVKNLKKTVYKRAFFTALAGGLFGSAILFSTDPFVLFVQFILLFAFIFFAGLFLYGWLSIRKYPHLIKELAKHSRATSNSERWNNHSSTDTIRAGSFDYFNNPSSPTYVSRSSDY